MSRATTGPEANAGAGPRSVGVALRAEPAGKPKEPAMSDRSGVAEPGFRGEDANDPLTFESAVPGGWSPSSRPPSRNRWAKPCGTVFPLSSRYARMRHPSKSTTSSKTCECSSNELAWHRRRPQSHDAPGRGRSPGQDAR
jgi:hypothetical protein